MKLAFNKIMSYKKILSLLLGFIAVSALPPFYYSFSLLLCFTFLLLLINNADSKSQAFSIGYWFGFGFYSLGFSWIGNALLIDAENLGWLYPISFISSGLFFGLFSAFPAYLSYLIKGPTKRYFLFAAYWVLFEWIRSFFLTGFPWNLIGTTLAFNTTLLQTASIWGTYGLSWVVILVASAPTLYILQKSKQSLALSLAMIFIPLIVLYSFGAYRLHTAPAIVDSNIKLRIVQPSIPQQFKWDRYEAENNFNEYIKMSKLDGFEDIDFTIWGETATPFALDVNPYYRKLAANAVKSGGYLITGSIRYIKDNQQNPIQPANSLIIISSDGNILNHYDKSHLVPFGEYIPLKKYLPDYIKPVTKFVGDFYQGSGPSNIKVQDYPDFGASICYEIIFPANIINKHHKPKWLVNATNDGWYGDSAGPYQHLVATQLRAIEEGLTIVRAANTGVSAVISQYGKILGQIELNKKDILDIYLPDISEINTLYNRLGNLLIILLVASNIAFILFYSKKKTTY